VWDDYILKISTKFKMTRWCWLWKSRPRMMSQQIVGRTFNLVNAYFLPSTTISVRQNPNDFTFTEVDVIRTWCEEGYKVELSLLQIVSKWINAVKTFPPTITGIDAFIRSPGQADIATHKDGVTDAEKVESLPLHLDTSLDRQARGKWPLNPGILSRVCQTRVKWGHSR